MDEIAYAKINLALRVREKRPDGYHRIETIFAFCEAGDVLRGKDPPLQHPPPWGGGEGLGVPDEVRRAAQPRTPPPALQGTIGAARARAVRGTALPPRSHEGRRDPDGQELSLQVVGPFAGPLAGEGDNLVLRAARALAARYRVREGVRLTLDKRLPVASGIGGGSADAAAALRLLVRFWQLEAKEAELLEIAAGLGADVPACLLSRTIRGEGRGDSLTPWHHDDAAGTPILLVNPGVAVSTAAVFARWDGIDRGPLPADPAEGRNDLEPAAIALAPVIAELLAALRRCAGVRLARMSGSGATCFALFDGAAARDAAAAAIGAACPHWWQLATRLRPD